MTLKTSFRKRGIFCFSEHGGGEDTLKHRHYKILISTFIMANLKRINETNVRKIPAPGRKYPRTGGVGDQKLISDF